MRQLTAEQAQTEYKEFKNNFDPSPIGYGEDYLYLPEFEEWLDEEDIQLTTAI